MPKIGDDTSAAFPSRPSNNERPPCIRTASPLDDCDHEIIEAGKPGYAKSGGDLRNRLSVFA